MNNSMKTKILVVVQNISKAQEHEWYVEYINREKFDIQFLLINCKGTYMDQFLVSRNVPVFHLFYSSKSELPGLTFRIFHLLRKEKFDIIHTHLFEATLAGLTAAMLAGVSRRIYTRHHSDYHHVYFPSAVKYDKYNNFLATAIVAISRNVQHILIDKENASASKVHLIHHGIDLSDYRPGAVEMKRVSAIKNKYDLNGPGPFIGAISRFTAWKGVQYIVPAFKELLKEYPTAILILANANGDYKAEILDLLKEINSEHVRLIQFENDIAALYKSFDCFVHVPIDSSSEAFGQTYIESLASQIPSVFTISGIAAEFIKDKVNAFVVPYKSSSAVKDAVLFVLNNKDSLSGMVEAGYEEVAAKFDIHIKISKLEQLYS